MMVSLTENVEGQRRRRRRRTALSTSNVYNEILKNKVQEFPSK